MTSIYSQVTQDVTVCLTSTLPSTYDLIFTVVIHGFVVRKITSDGGIRGRFSPLHSKIKYNGLDTVVMRWNTSVGF